MEWSDSPSQFKLRKITANYFGSGHIDTSQLIVIYGASILRIVIESFIEIPHIYICSAQNNKIIWFILSSLQHIGLQNYIVLLENVDLCCILAFQIIKSHSELLGEDYRSFT